MSKIAKVVFTTYENRDQAIESITSLLNDRLVACAQMIDIESMYSWQGERQLDKEVLALLKTTDSAYPELKRALDATHPYEVPELICVDSSDVASAYMQWMDAMTTREQ